MSHFYTILGNTLDRQDFEGVELIKKIKEKSPSTSLRTGRGKIPVIIMTDIAQANDRKITEWKKAGVVDFLLKPFDVNDFLSVVSRYLK